MRNVFASLFLFVLLLFSNAAYANNDCNVDILEKDYAQLLLSIFGKTPINYLIDSNDIEQKKAIEHLTSQDIRRCTKNFSTYSENPTRTGLVIMYLLATPLLMIVIVAFVINKSSTAMISENKVYTYTANIIIALLLLVSVLPLKPLSLKNKDISLESLYSPLHHLVFKAISVSINATEKLSLILSPVPHSVLPSYHVPKVSYLSTLDNKLNEFDYEMNRLTNILTYAACVVTEKPTEVSIPKPVFSYSSKNMMAKFGTDESVCSLTVSVKKDVYSSSNLKMMQDAPISFSDFEKRERMLFESTVSELLDKAFNFKKELYKNVADTRATIKDRHLTIVINEKGSLAALPLKNSYEVADIVKAERDAEISLSGIVVNKYLPPDFSSDSKNRQYSLSNVCDKDLSSCVQKVCSYDTTIKQSGVFNCALAISSLKKLKSYETNNERGFISRTLNLWDTTSKADIPTQVQMQLSSWLFEFKENISNSTDFSVERREFNNAYKDAVSISEVGKMGVQSLLSSSSPFDVDLFDVSRMNACIDAPNQSVFRKDDQGNEYLYANCGTVLQTLDGFGNNLMKASLALQSGRLMSPLVSKTFSKITSKKDSETDGAISGKDTLNENITKLISAAFGSAAILFISELATAPELLPFSNPNSDLSSLTSASAFALGAAFSDSGALSWLATTMLFCAVVLKYGIKVVLIGVVLYYFMFVWLKTLVVSVPTTIYRAISIMSDENALFEKLSVLSGQLILLVVFPPLLFGFVFVIPQFIDLMAQGSLSALNAWIVGAIGNGSATASIISSVIFSVLVSFAIILPPFAAIGLIHKLYDLVSDVCGDTSAALLSAQNKDAALLVNDAKNSVKV